MKKKKDGTVIASLTEVKNKTGDIFALADEYGEVILTSYNKPRYKIVKLEITSLFEEDKSEVKTPAEPKTKPLAPSVRTTPVQQSVPVPTKPAMIDKLITLAAWDRNNSKETSFAARATRGLIN